jgi:hypothetical protein
MAIDWKNETAVKAGVKKFPGIFAEELRLGLIGIADLLVGTIVELTPVGTGDSQWGHLSNSIQGGEPVRTQGGWRVEIGTPAEYASVIENGRSPGARRPPTEAIAKWVWGKRFLFPDVKTEKDALRIAFPIAKKIGEVGFSSAAQGAGKGWGMFAEAIKKDDSALRQLAGRIKWRISYRCTKAAAGG